MMRRDNVKLVVVEPYFDLKTPNNIGSQTGDYETARLRYEEALTISRADGDRHGIATHLNNLGVVAWRQRDLEGARVLFDQATREMRELGDADSLASALGNLANIARAQGDIPASASYLLEGLRVIKGLGAKRLTLMLLEVGSDLAGLVGEPLRAVTLRGVADTLREDSGTPFATSEREAQEETVARLRQQVGAGGFDEAWQAGRALGVDEAFVETLTWLQNVTPTNGSSATG